MQELNHGWSPPSTRTCESESQPHVHASCHLNYQQDELDQHLVIVSHRLRTRLNYTQQFLRIDMGSVDHQAEAVGI